MNIEKVILSPGHGAYFYDDQLAIRGGAPRDGEVYTGKALTPGFTAIRMPARALGIGLQLDDGHVVWGDMMSVQYSGVAGRDPVFHADSISQAVENSLVPRLVGAEVCRFRTSTHDLFAGAAFPKAVMYGVTQALLAAAAHASRRTICEVICDEYDFPCVSRPVPMFAQCGSERYANVDKMILRRIEVLPHGLINSPGIFGSKGELFLDYVRWVSTRIRAIGGHEYSPTLHFDLYGMAGEAFAFDLDQIAEYLGLVHAAAAPFSIRIESPADLGSRGRQIEAFATLRALLRQRGTPLELVADEWCNTLEDTSAFVAAQAADVIQLKMPDLGSLDEIVRGIQICRQGGIGVYLGGSCTETDISARISTHIGVAAQVDMLLAKPGMGVDEGHMIVANEQARLMAILGSRKTRHDDAES